MGRFLKPDYWIEDVSKITPDWLLQQGITVVCSDIDNTIALHDGMDISDDVLAWIKQLQENKIEIMLVSNNSETRVAPVAKKLGVLYAAKAGKPGSKKLLSLLGEHKRSVLLVGDQLLTDIWCGNRCGFKTVLTDPIGKDILLQIKLKRGLEWVIKCFWNRKKMSL